MHVKAGEWLCRFEENALTVEERVLSKEKKRRREKRIKCLEMKKREIYITNDMKNWRFYIIKDMQNKFIFKFQLFWFIK